MAGDALKIMTQRRDDWIDALGGKAPPAPTPVRTRPSGHLEALPTTVLRQRYQRYRKLLARIRREFAHRGITP